MRRVHTKHMAVAQSIGGEHADLAVADLARRTGISPGHPARRTACLRNLVSSITSTASSSARVSTA